MIYAYKTSIKHKLIEIILNSRKGAEIIYECMCPSSVTSNIITLNKQRAQWLQQYDKHRRVESEKCMRENIIEIQSLHDTKGNR